MTFRIDQVGLATGTSGARTDGLDNGAVVTLTNLGGGTTRFELLWTPPGDTTAVASLAATAPGATTWTFTPTASVYGSYLIRLIRNEGAANEEVVRRVFSVRTPNQGFRIPALNELGDPDGSLLNSGAEVVAASDDNAQDYVEVALNSLHYSGWWRALHEWILGLDTLVGGGEVNLAANVGGGAAAFRDKTGVTFNFRTFEGEGGIVVEQDGDVLRIDGSAVEGTPVGAGLRGAGVFGAQWTPITASGQEESPLNDTQELRVQWLPGFNRWGIARFVGVDGPTSIGEGAGAISIHYHAGREGGIGGLDMRTREGGAAGGWMTEGGTIPGTASSESPMATAIIPIPGGDEGIGCRWVLCIEQQAATTQKVWFSDDGGVTWDTGDLTTNSVDALIDMVWTGQHLIGVYPAGSNPAEYSTDGETWAASTMSSPFGMKKVLSDGETGLCLMAGAGAEYKYSTDHGVNWTNGLITGFTGSFRDAVFWRGRFYVLSSDQSAYTSTNGVDWTRLDLVFTDPKFQNTAEPPDLASRYLVVVGDLLACVMWDPASAGGGINDLEDVFYSADGLRWESSGAFGNFIVGLGDGVDDGPFLRCQLASSTPPNPGCPISDRHQLYLSPSVADITNTTMADGYVSPAELTTAISGVQDPTTDAVTNVSDVPGADATDALNFLYTNIGGGVAGVVWDPDVGVDTTVYKATLAACVAAIPNGYGVIYMQEGASAAFDDASSSLHDFENRIALVYPGGSNETLTFTDPGGGIVDPWEVVSPNAQLTIERGADSHTQASLTINTGNRSLRLSGVTLTATTAGDAPTLRLAVSSIQRLRFHNCIFDDARCVYAISAGGVTVELSGSRTQFHAADLFRGFSGGFLLFEVGNDLNVWDTSIVGGSFTGSLANFTRPALIYPSNQPLLEGLLNDGVTNVNVISHSSSADDFLFNGVRLLTGGSSSLFLAADGVYRAAVASAELAVGEIIWDPDLGVDTAVEKAAFEDALSALSAYKYGRIIMVPRRLAGFSDGDADVFQIAAAAVLDMDSRVELVNPFPGERIVELSDSATVLLNPARIKSEGIHRMILRRATPADTAPILRYTDNIGGGIEPHVYLQNVTDDTTRNTGAHSVVEIQGSDRAVIESLNSVFLANNTTAGIAVTFSETGEYNYVRWTVLGGDGGDYAGLALEANMIAGATIDAVFLRVANSIRIRDVPDIWADGVVSLSMSPLTGQNGATLVKGLLNDGDTEVDVIEHDGGADQFLFNGVPLTDAGDPSHFLAADGTYKAVAGASWNAPMREGYRVVSGAVGEFNILPFSFDFVIGGLVGGPPVDGETFTFLVDGSVSGETPSFYDGDRQPFRSFLTLTNLSGTYYLGEPGVGYVTERVLRRYGREWPERAGNYDLPLRASILSNSTLRIRAYNTAPYNFTVALRITPYCRLEEDGTMIWYNEAVWT